MSWSTRDTGGFGQADESTRRVSLVGGLDGPLFVTPFKRLRYLRQYLASSVRFRQEWDIEGLEPMLRQHLRWVGRHVENALIGPLLQYVTPSRYPIALRHYHIDHEQVDPALGEAQHIQGFHPGVGLEDPEALLRKNPVRDSA